MLLTTRNRIPGYRIVKTVGLVRGNVVRARPNKSGLGSFRKNETDAGEIKDYSQALEEARDLAEERMSNRARALGADGIVSIQFSTAQVMGEATEVLVAGTAVKLARQPQGGAGNNQAQDDD